MQISVGLSVSMSSKVSDNGNLSWCSRKDASSLSFEVSIEIAQNAYFTKNYLKIE